MIPNIFHFILISKDGITNPVMQYYMYVSIKSAHIHNRPDKIYLYTTKGLNPVGPWFDRCISEIPEIEIEEVEDFDEIFGNKIYHFTHKTDVIRIKKLIERGGIYMDLDTITLQDLSTFRNHKFVTCREDDSWRIGCAVMMCIPRSIFASDILELYKNFRSKGRDEYYVEVSEELPYKIWEEKYKGTDEVFLADAFQILSPMTLCDWKGNQIYFKRFFDTDDFPLDGRYILHLWTELTKDKIGNLDRVLEENTTYSNLIKKYI